MTETTYDLITKSLDRISQKLHLADENKDFSRVWLLSGQLNAIKENLQRLLWIELPELNEGQKYRETSHSSTQMFFNPGIFEHDAMRKAFFKRQAKAFFKTEEEQQAYIVFTEEEYLKATTKLTEIYNETHQRMSQSGYQARKSRTQAEFIEAMKQRR